MLIKKSESGRSMIEMLGVLAIMGVLTIGAIQLVSYAMATQKKGTVETEIVQIYQGVRNIFSAAEDYSALDNGVFGAMGISQKNPYGGTYSVSADVSNPRQFTVHINGLPKSDCEYFKLKRWTESVEYINSNGQRGGAVATPADCSDRAGNNTVSITYF